MIEGSIKGKEQTVKSDKRNHGYGIQNVREAVEKYQGTMKRRCENGIYGVKVRIHTIN